MVHEELGIDTSPTALSNFYSWYTLRKATQDGAQAVEGLLSQIREAAPELSEEQLFAMGQQFFQQQALAKMDHKAWYLVNQTAREREDSELKRRKFQVQTCELFLKWFEEKQAREIATSTASNREKIEALGQLIFKDAW